MPWCGWGGAAVDILELAAGFLDPRLNRGPARLPRTPTPQYSSSPVVNGLTDYNHPCQVGWVRVRLAALARRACWHGPVAALFSGAAWAIGVATLPRTATCPL